MNTNGFDLEEPSSPVCYKLDCFPRLYTSKRWGKSFKTVYQLIRQDFVTRSCLFDRVMEHEMLHWVCSVEIAFNVK